MLISHSIVEQTIARATRAKLDPTALAQALGEGDRSRHASPAQRRARFAQLLTQTGDPESARRTLERILGGNDLVPITYLQWGVIVSRGVCRIRLRDATGATIGFGTGFLVAPGVLMTNHHVISGAGEARGAQAEFDYELDLRGREKVPVVFDLQVSPSPIAVESLDFCLAAVAGRSIEGGRNLADFGHLVLNGTPGKTVVGEYLTIIQHPGGERKQVCVRENKLLKYDEGGDTLWYNTDTVAGSSGSPVFNNSWDVVALHHSGVPKRDAQGNWLTIDGKIWDASMDESRVAWIANEGMRISRILEHLRSHYASHPLALAVLDPKPAPMPPEGPVGVPSAQAQQIDGELRVVIPVQIAVRVGAAAPIPVPGAVFVQPDAYLGSNAAALAADAGVETVDVDQTNYAKRTGYRPDFLGTSAPIPLPRIAAAALKRQVLMFTASGKRTTELKYWNYSVAMHQARKLAIYSAVNVNAHARPADANREGDRWYFDTRLDEADQIGNQFYGAQKTFEIDRSKNPFDRGHLTRRMDATWGRDDDTAKRNGDDSFHFTNCSPQHWRFNQGAKRWLGLEDYVIDTFASDTGKACVINGPVFDAPPSRRAADGRIVPNLSGRKRKDPTFGGVAIPKLFYKVVVCRRADGDLAAAAFLVSQEDFLATVDRLQNMPPIEDERLTTPEARLYQVPVASLAALTGLDFGAIGKADGDLEGLAVEGTRIITELRDIQVRR